MFFHALKRSFLLFLGKAYFDIQPSWFDTLANNARCLKIENFPITAKDLEVMKNTKSHSKPFTEPSKGMKKETCPMGDKTVFLLLITCSFVYFDFHLPFFITIRQR